MDVVVVVARAHLDIANNRYRRRGTYAQGCQAGGGEAGLELVLHGSI